MAPPRSRYRQVLLALVFCAVAFMVLTRVLSFGARAPFTLVLTLIVLSNLYWWSWVDARLARHSAAEGTDAASVRRPRPRGLVRVLWNAYMAGMMAPLAASALIHRAAWDALPSPVIAWLMIWHFCIVGVVSVSAVVAAVGMVLRGVHSAAAVSAEPSGAADATGASAGDMPPHAGLTRRALLARATLAGPLVLTASALAAESRDAGRFQIRRYTVSMPRLPSRLRGLTITHISDMHVGRLFRPEHLPRLVNAVNTLRSDLVVVTGDTLDHSNEYLPPACEALAALEHRYGRFIIEGNHDLLDSPRDFRIYMKAHEGGFLTDQYARVEIDGECIQVAGLSWTGRGGVQGDRYVSQISAALEGSDPDVFTIALTHDPHAFDTLAGRGVDLTLAGHTHGGQLMLTPRGFPGQIGAGSLLFRYIYGFYQIGESQLYVNAGVGNWFPVRLNAPEEIVQIRLV